MSEQFILEYIHQRIKQLGYSKYHLRYRDLIIEQNSSMRIQAANELYFICGEPEGLSVESEYGVYDTIAAGLPVLENAHQHRGEIVITNPNAPDKRIKFIQVIIVN
jgi:hypothetical protein